jgi:REP element-mobilizing transposase RayT
MVHYERRLPHWDSPGIPLFVTFRLYGSLPASRIYPPKMLISSGRAFRAMDRLLDTASTGPLYLKIPSIAVLVEQAILDGEQRFGRYALHAWVVMANHVHLLVTPKFPSTKWLGPLKGFTAHEANKIMGMQGQHFWQDESYDRLVRTETEFGRIKSYIERNPVSAGLVTASEEFPYSSGRPPGLAAPLRCY